MSKRRDFIKNTLLGSAGLLALNHLEAASRKKRKPVVISTWNFGLKANEEAWKVLGSSGSALDAIEKGVRLIESDPSERSVGLGGRPDRDGVVTLDACIMDHKGNIGSVAALEKIENPISVARAVMEKTPHVMIVGAGAQQFALQQGFELKNLLTPESEAEWREWLKTSKYKPVINIENHDTIGMVGLDSLGNLGGACTTSGLAWKMHGRVGDSPIIGAGLYVDNEAGAATATGHGEEVIRVVGSFRVVQNMKHGMSPKKACAEAVKEIKKLFVRRGADWSNTQIGFLAINTRGETGAFALRKGFNYAEHDSTGNVLKDAEFLL
ncbi:MAG: N(4)-(beta-N-acetylglucosaminyl)-L-asparaginase [Bacteroidetes bacterium]|nr:N(4)-(beta-N-acetylglucosaminyl)-L-asparaginase [Bacteroidota bacterium]